MAKRISVELTPDVFVNLLSGSKIVALIKDFQIEISLEKKECPNNLDEALDMVEHNWELMDLENEDF